MLAVHFAPSFSAIISLGVVGVGLASWLGDDDLDEDGDVGDDDFGGMDDDFDMDGFDDDFGGMDDLGDGGGGSTSELEHRIEDLESEIANVSSTANTVRSENEQISETVDDVEENVRKLLEIYEMVTRGVNPFVDDVSPNAGMGGGGGFGLFGADEGADEPDDEDLDSDIADAEAEDFFDDDAFEDFDDEFADEDEDIDEFDDTDGFEDTEDAFDEGAALEEDWDDDVGDADDGSSGGGGLSFEELKAEYESGEADWADDDLDESEDDDGELETATTEAPSTDDDEPGDLFQEDDLTGGVDPDVDGGGESEMADDEGESESADPLADESQPTEPSATTDTVAGSGFEFGTATDAATADRPRLRDPPDGYLADVVVLEWLDFLVSEFDARNAVRAINYYERIGWIGEPMADHCFAVIEGIADVEYLYRDEFGPTDLTMDDHRRSLGYIEDLVAGRLDRELGERLLAAEEYGIQR